MFRVAGGLVLHCEAECAQLALVYTFCQYAYVCVYVLDCTYTAASYRRHVPCCRGLVLLCGAECVQH